ncbi:MAG: DUF6644 family protein [Vicinamibacterales bacterium]
MLLSFFEWCETTAVGSAIRNSSWLFPAIESVHLLALAMIGGALVVVDLRLAGLGLRGQSVRQIARDAQPWLVGSLVMMIATGVPLFLSESIKCYYNQAFWVKMTLLAVAILFTFTARRKVAMADETRVKPYLRGLVALISLTLWFGVAAAGRWIGFS